MAVGGTWMCKSDMIKAGKWEEITAICKEAVKTMLGFELAHIGVNCENEAEAERTAKTLCALFGLEYKAGNSSIFAGKAVECMKKPGRGPTDISPSPPTAWTGRCITWAVRAWRSTSPPVSPRQSI